MTATADVLTTGSPYQGYAYSYPHKTAYRRLPEPVPLRELWAGEPRSSLLLYFHVPFCEMRCGFCNLFTQARPKEGVAHAYLDTLERQARQVRGLLGDVSFARLAIGGGTPTALELRELERLCNLAEEMLGGPIAVPASVETSPETADWEKLTLLRTRGVSRISIGVQSFLEAETSAVGRPQRLAAVQSALERIRSVMFPVLNVDLIYGLPGQTVATWLHSVRSALRYFPEELYLYPLYVRPQTGLGRSHRTWDDLRLKCYREAVSLLRAEGYEQTSMRMFRARHSPDEDGPVYCCQRDGMIGLGCGVRSYTSRLHYSDEFAVRSEGVREILEAYVARPAEAFGFAVHGMRIDGEEQRRRHVLMSLLQCTGLSLEDYEHRFGSDPFEDLPELRELEPAGLARHEAKRLLLTEAGLERSDAIGPSLYSETVRQRMESYSCR